MISATILLAAQKAADPVPTWIPVLAAVTSAGIATILVNLVKGFWVSAQDRGPRSRVQAIRNGAETLKLLVPGSAAYQAVENHVLAEAEALAVPPRRWWNWIGFMSVTVDLDTSAMPDESIGPLGVPYRAWVDTYEKRARVCKIMAKVNLAIAAVVLTLTVLSFFAPWSLEDHVSTAIAGGTFFAVVLSFGLMLRRASYIQDAGAKATLLETNEDDTVKEDPVDDRPSRQ